jgi:hypothetical protein
MGALACRGDTLSGPFSGELHLLAIGEAAKATSEATKLVLLADGKRLVFSSVQRRDLSQDVQLVAVSVASDTMAIIAEAKAIEGRLGTLDFTFSPATFAGLGQLLRSSPPATRPSR